MDINIYLEKIKKSEEYSSFIKDNPESFLFSCFFSIDIEGGKDNKIHFDFYSPSTKKIASFQIEESIKMVPLDFGETGSEYQKLNTSFNLDIKGVRKMILDEMEIKNITNKIQKIFISLQPKNGKTFWICTIFISGFGILSTHIDDELRKIIFFEKKSFFDILNVFKKK